MENINALGNTQQNTNTSPNSISAYGFDIFIQEEIAKIQALIEKENAKKSISHQKTESHTTPIVNEENKKQKLETGAEGAHIAELIDPEIDLKHISKCINQYFIKFEEATFQTFKRRTNKLLETLNKAIAPPLESIANLKPKRSHEHKILINIIRSQLDIIQHKITKNNNDTESTTLSTRFKYMTELLNSEKSNLKVNYADFQIENTNEDPFLR